ncbi:type II methionyl aminopeptidase [Candidatus Woesearchaeota archaeon]|nr:type II methionyl aminopeptidase [Candidatus Woesearchaeota archaeon]
MDDYDKAGRIAAEARDYGASLIKVGVSLLEVTERVEERILKLGGKFAFPPQISRNEIAAHYCAFTDDPIIFDEGDIVKLDVGVHVNGYIGDTAITVDLDKNINLLRASEHALRNALKIIRPGVTLGEIGKEIEQTIQEEGFEPIRNLSGHGLGLYQIHAPPSVPNYDNKSTKILKEGQVVAIEPFATTGKGMICEGKPSGIFRWVGKKAVRHPKAREVLKYIESEFKTLPFTKRWIMKKYSMGEFYLRLLEKEGIIQEYAQLPEISNGLVSQAEHTIRVEEKAKILTKV